MSKKRSSKTKRIASERAGETNAAPSNAAALPVIGIIGVAGRYGRWMQARFRELGFRVIGSDVLAPEPGTENETSRLSSKQVVKQADVVIFSVPIDQTVSVIRSLVPFARPTQLWIDITSLKQQPIQAMLESCADVIGLHPMCGPDLPNWNGQTVALCYGRLQHNHWETFVIDFLQAMKAKYYVTDALEHDRIMAYVQALPHALSMMMIGVLQSLEQHGLNVSEIEHYATPPYRLSVAAVSRILATHPELYADIQVSNRQHTLEVLASLVQQAQEIHAAVQASDRTAIVQRLVRGRQEFRSRNIQSGMKGFLQMSRVMADFSTDNSKIIHTRRDEAGILEKILKLFAQNRVNLTGLHSFKSDEYDGFSFHFGLEGPRDSLSLQRALCEMRNSDDLRELIVIEDP